MFVTVQVPKISLVKPRIDAIVAVVGGTEALLAPYAFGMACAAGLLSKRHDTPEAASRPFDVQRDGLVFSEGAEALARGNS